jgi:hypothetical protein
MGDVEMKHTKSSKCVQIVLIKLKINRRGYLVLNNLSPIFYKKTYLRVLLFFC